MQMIKDTINNIKVIYIKTDKFKSVSGALYFKSPLTKETYTAKKLLGTMLVKSCKKYDTNEKLNVNTLENYDAFYVNDLIRCGNYLINMFGFNCINDKFVDDKVIDKVVDTFCELIHNPNVQDNKFNKAEFDLYYKKLKTKLETEKERTRTYGYNKLLKKMDENNAFSIKPSLEYLQKLNEYNLYEEYLNLINNSEIELYLVGNFDYKLVANKVLANLKSKTFNIEKFNKNVINKEKLEIYKETLNTSGSIMYFGLKLFDLNDYERSYVMPIYSCILGGGAASRCFNTIREENSLAYYCYSRYDKDDQLLTLIAGIEKKNFDKTMDLMLKVLDSMKQIKEKEIKRAKKEIITSLKQTEDSSSSLISSNYFREFYNEDEMEKRIENFDKVSINDLLKLNDKMIKDTIYLLEGDK